MINERDWVKVAQVGDLGPGQGFDTGVEVAGDIVGVFFIDGVYYAVGECSHERGPISQGAIDGLEVTCPWHSAKYDVSTGECSQGAVACRTDGQVVMGDGNKPERCKSLNCYEVRIEDTDIMVRPRSAQWRSFSCSTKTRPH